MPPDDPYQPDDEQETRSETAGSRRVVLPTDKYGRVVIREGTGDTSQIPHRVGADPVPISPREPFRVGGVWKEQPTGRFDPRIHVGAMPTRLPYDPTTFSGSTAREVRPPYEVEQSLAVTGDVPIWIWDVLYGWACNGIEPPDFIFHLLGPRPGSQGVIAYATRLREELRGMR